jgi:hypothetical protein
MESIITTSAVTTLHAGTEYEIRTVEIVTDGRVGAESEAAARACTLFDSGFAHLSRRVGEWGELRFTYTDRLVTY